MLQTQQNLLQKKFQGSGEKKQENRVTKDGANLLNSVLTNC